MTDDDLAKRRPRCDWPGCAARYGHMSVAPDDWLIVLRGQGGENVHPLKAVFCGMACLKRKMNDDLLRQPIGVKVTFDGRYGTVSFQQADVRDTPELQARRPLRGRIRDELRHGAKTGSDLATALDANRESITATMRAHNNTFVQINPSVGGKETLWGLRD